MIKTTDLPRELKQFNSHFFGFQYKYDVGQIFEDLLSIIIACMGRGTSEPLYFETIKKYSADELQHFVKMFGELAIIYGKAKQEGDWCDPLGDYYEALASNYKKSRFGQFFTPKPLCDMMAMMLLTDVWGLNVNEPCSGSGRMVLAANRKTKGNYYVCEDLDPICCKMTAINMCFHEIRGEVHCRDVLRAPTENRFIYAVNYEFWKHKTTCILQYKPA